MQLQFQFTTFQFNITSIQCQFNPIQFNFVSIQFNFMKIDFLKLGRAPPTASRKLQFFKRICNQKIMIFRRPPDLDFSDFSGGQKTNLFHCKNNRFWSFFDRNPKILDLDRKLYDFHVKNNDFAAWDEFSFDSSTFLEHWCPENKAKQRFHDQNVRQFYVFGTLMSGNQSKTTISWYRNKKERKKNAANDAQGKRNSISGRFMRNQKTARVR